MKNGIRILIIVAVICAFVLTILYMADMRQMKKGEKVFFSTWGYDYAPIENEPVQDKPNKEEANISLALSLEDKITDNTVWCGTFNLIWNDLKNDIAKQDIVFENQTEVIDNLNKGTFDISNLADSSYYKVYGHPTLKLKEEIEKAIKEKFDETSNILDDFDFVHVSDEDYFLYCMLKKKFEFENKFTKLNNGRFGSYENVKYFGTDNDTDYIVKNQIKVLYYNSENEFAIKLYTKTNDEVIIEKGGKDNSFYDTYMSIIDKEKSYSGNKHLSESENFKMPEISFKLKNNITEVENKNFSFADGSIYNISKAMQTVEFELDENGGKIKSEAGMMVQKTTAIMETKIRSFNVDNTFTIFLIEKDSNLPYFAAKVADITKFQ